jgi:hypothetical protein
VAVVAVPAEHSTRKRAAGSGEESGCGACETRSCCEGERFRGARHHCHDHRMQPQWE